VQHRLQDASDDEAWERFYHTYWALIVSFAVRKGCTRTMADDVLQETMIRLTRVMPAFVYDREKGRFRAFLLTIVRNATVDRLRREQKYAAMGESDNDRTTWSARVEDEVTPPPWEEDWAREWEHHVLRQALAAVKERVEPETYESFRLYVLEERSVAEVCGTLGMDRNTVYQHRNRLIRMLRTEVKRIDAELEEPMT